MPKFEEALQLEFGRGFRYTRPLRLNVMDLDYELMEELVSRLKKALHYDLFFAPLPNIQFSSAGQHCREAVLWSTVQVYWHQG